MKQERFASERTQSTMLEYILQLWQRSLTTQALVVGIVVGVSVYLLLKKRYKMPPGPRGWPVIGNVLSFRKGLMFLTLHEMSKQYGPVMTIHIGMTPTIVLSKIDAVLEALVKRQADFAGRPQHYSGNVFSDNGRDIVFSNYGPTWKLHRKIASKAIRQYLIEDSFTKKVNESLVITADLMKAEAGPFDPFPFLSLLVFNVLSGVCFNKTCSKLEDERFKMYVGQLDQINQTFGNGFLEDYFTVFRLWPTQKFRQFSNLVKKFQSSIQDEVNEHKRSFTVGLIRDFTDTILQAQIDIESEEDPELLAQITDVHVRQTILDVFFAGIETTRSTLQWTLLALALNPDIQEKVHAEVDKVIGPDLTVSVNDREHLPYTEAVLHESMRLRHVGPLGLPRVTLVDTSVGGYEIPKGTMVIINCHALHFDADKWEDVDAFKPERFLDSFGKMGPKPESWLAFSAGRRVCLGETVAKPELHLLLAGICRAFTIELEPGTEHDFEPKSAGFVNLPGRFKIVTKSRI